MHGRRTALIARSAHTRRGTRGRPGGSADSERAPRASAPQPTLDEAQRGSQLRAWARRRARADQGERSGRAGAGRWTLVDRIEHDGERYVLAREEAPAPRGQSALSSRERQAAALAALGRTNKGIARELGLADSTVRVLLGRAAAKLGASSREELIARVRASESAER